MNETRMMGNNKVSREKWQEVIKEETNKKESKAGSKLMNATMK